MPVSRLVVALSGAVLFPAGVALAETIVPGSANPNLAGRSIGYACCGGDAAPAQSPALVDIPIEDCATVEFSATGKVSFEPGLPTGNNPDGDAGFSMTNYGDGISAPLGVRANALVAVFLGDESPTGSATPVQYDFGAGLDFPILFTELGAMFFVGDGRDSDSQAGDFDGAVQQFIAPRGATRLFLGTADGSGWYNNTGSFTVDVHASPSEAERGCGDPVDPVGIAASDALRVLRVAVGTALCQDCVCDVDRSGAVVAGDALVVLKSGVGQPVKLNCECCPPMV